MQDHISSSYKECIQTLISSSEALPSQLEQAANAMVNCLLNGNKVVTCGVGPSKMLAQHLASLLVNYYEIERPCLPSIALKSTAENLSLTADNYVEIADAYARQVRALGQPNDILVAIAPTGYEKQVISSVEASLTKDMIVIALTGADGGEISGLLGSNDVEIRVPSNRPSRIVEAHLFNIHCLCELIDNSLFNQSF